MPRLAYACYAGQQQVFPRFSHRCVWTLNNNLTEQILLLRR